MEAPRCPAQGDPPPAEVASAEGRTTTCKASTHTGASGPWPAEPQARTWELETITNWAEGSDSTWGAGGREAVGAGLKFFYFFLFNPAAQ